MHNSIEGRQRALMFLITLYFPIKIEDAGFSDKVLNHSNLKILTPKQMLHRLPIAHSQVIAGNTSENLLNEFKQIIYSLYQAKEITKKVYNNIISSKKL